MKLDRERVRTYMPMSMVNTDKGKIWANADKDGSPKSNEG